MRKLRVIGVSDDGDALLLAGDESAKVSHRIPVDERLRAAVRGRLNPGERAEIALPPKELQARLRAGESVEQVAKAAGVPVARIMSFIAPVLAERQRMVDEARTALLHRTRGPEGRRPLGETVDAHLATVAGLRPDSVDWTARRRPDGAWVVAVSYAARGGRREASWLWRPAQKELTALDASASRLASDEEPAQRPARRTATKRPARKAAATRSRPAAKRTAKKTATRAAKPVRKKPAARKTATATPARKVTATRTAPTTSRPTKATAKRTAAKRPAATKTTAKRTAAPKRATTKSVAKRTSPTTRAKPVRAVQPVKKVTAVTTSTRKATAAKKAVAKRAAAARTTVTRQTAPAARPSKVVARKVAVPKVVTRKVAAPKVVTRKPAAGKPAASKPAVSKPAARHPAVPDEVVTPRKLTVVPPPPEQVAEPTPAPVPAPEPVVEQPVAAVAARRRPGQRVPVPSWSEVLLGVAPRERPASPPSEE